MIETDVGICNLALDKLGTANITSLDEQYNDNAKICKQWYDVTRRTLIKDINASFAIKRISIASNGDTDVIDNYKKFPIPSDCLNILQVYSATKERIKDFNLEENNILIDGDSPLYVRYVADVTDVSKYDDEFKELFALYLACNISQKVTQNTELTTYLEGLKRQKYMECSFKYGNDNKIKVVSTSKFMQSKVW